MSTTAAAVMLVKAMYAVSHRPVMVPELQVQLYELDERNETLEDLRRGGGPALFLALRRARAEGFLEHVEGVQGGYTLAPNAGQEIENLIGDDVALRDDVARAAQAVAGAAA